MESDRPLKYSNEGRLSAPTPSTWGKGSEVPNLGQATGDQHLACSPFLIVQAAANINVESSLMFDGVQRFDVQQSSNPDSVVLRPGGGWTDGSLVSGSITTISKSPISQALMRSAHSAVKKHFTRIQAFWVGPETLISLREGRRLTYAVQSPPEYSLREPVP